MTYLRLPYPEPDVHKLKLSVTDLAVRYLLLMDTVGWGGEAVHACVMEDRRITMHGIEVKKD